MYMLCIFVTRLSFAMISAVKVYTLALITKFKTQKVSYWNKNFSFRKFFEPILADSSHFSYPFCNFRSLLLKGNPSNTLARGSVATKIAQNANNR